MDRVNMSGAVLVTSDLRAEIDASANKEIRYIMPNVDDKLDPESQNPIQNKVYTKRSIEER